MVPLVLLWNIHPDDAIMSTVKGVKDFDIIVVNDHWQFTWQLTLRVLVDV